MSLKNKVLSLTAAAVGIVGLTTFTLAQDQSAAPAPQKSERHARDGKGHFGPKGGHGKFGMHGGMFRMLHGLDLTDAQKTQIQTIMQANKPDQATMEQMKALRQAKRAGTLTAEQQETMKAFHTQQMEKMKAVHAQIIGILTPDQVTKLEQRKQKMQERRQQWKTRHQQNPGTATDTPAVQ